MDAFDASNGLIAEPCSPHGLLVRPGGDLYAGTIAWSTPLTAAVTVLPLWYETTAARAAGGVVALGLVVGVVRGLIPICASCKKIRDDGGYWNQLEEFIAANSKADFSHGLCPQCLEVEFSEIAQATHRRSAPGGSLPPAGEVP